MQQLKLLWKAWTLRAIQVQVFPTREVCVQHIARQCAVCLLLIQISDISHFPSPAADIFYTSVTISSVSRTEKKASPREMTSNFREKKSSYLERTSNMFRATLNMKQRTNIL